MPLTKASPIDDAMQRIMTNFENFDRKLDKLQSDVKVHGQTLDNLRKIVETQLPAHGEEKPKRLRHTENMAKNRDKIASSSTRILKRTAKSPNPAPKPRADSFERRISPNKARKNVANPITQGAVIKRNKHSAKSDSVRKSNFVKTTRKGTERKRGKLLTK